MKKYFEIKFEDYIFCCFISLGISINVFAGYDMNDPWSDHLFVIAGAVLVLMMIQFASYYNWKSKLFSIPVTLAMVTAVIIMMQAAEAFTGIATIDQSPFLTWIIVVITSIFVFWLTRTRTGIVILLLTGICLTTVFDFLKYPVSLPGYLIFIFGVIVLFLYRVLDGSLRRDTGQACLKGYFVQSVLASVLVILLAAGFYYGIIKPLSPPTAGKELTQKLMSVQILQDLGVATKKIIYTDRPIDKAEMLKNQQNEETQKQKNEATDNNDEKEKRDGGRIGAGTELIPALAITIQKIANALWMAVPAAGALLILAIGIKRFLRRKWYKNLLEKTKEDSAVELYLLFINKMQKVGLKRPSNLTLLEYALDSKEKLDQFTAYDASFLRLTEIYLAILYGYQKISEKECDLFYDYYNDFYQNLRKEMGSFKYYLQFFWI